MLAYTQPVNQWETGLLKKNQIIKKQSRALSRSLISEYPGYSLISEPITVRKKHYSLVGYTLTMNIYFLLSNQSARKVLFTCLTNIIHHTSFFRCSPRGFSATCLQQMQGSVVEGLSQTAASGSQYFFVWDIKLCPQLTVRNTGISLLLSTSVWVLLSPPIERRETRATA